MGSCNIDHSLEDVKKKYESQKQFLPNELLESFEIFFQKEHSQSDLNEVFHLLKKYDLADEEERKSRDEQLRTFLRI